MWTIPTIQGSNHNIYKQELLYFIKMATLAFIMEQLKETTDELLFAYMRNITNEEKFPWLKLYYLTNPFLTSAQRNDGLLFFGKIQRTYWAFIFFIRRWKIYKARKNVNQEDLCMNQLSSLPAKHKIYLLDQQTLYEFRLTDLLHICCSALTYSIGLQPAAQWPKNPYTGLPFTIAHLYAIYFKLQDTRITIPYYIQLFFRWNFSLSTFTFELYPLLKDFAIKNYLLDSSDDTLLFEIEHMVKDICKDIHFMNTDKMTVSKKKETLLMLKPHLKTYLLGNHSNNQKKKYTYQRKARKNVRKFFRKHPHFGRRIVRVRRSNQ